MSMGFWEGSILSSGGLEGGKVLRNKGMGRFEISVNENVFFSFAAEDARRAGEFSSRKLIKPYVELNRRWMVCLRWVLLR
jgi:hypothetical protein